jgi:hypothetical protein
MIPTIERINIKDLVLAGSVERQFLHFDPSLIPDKVWENAERELQEKATNSFLTNGYMNAAADLVIMSLVNSNNPCVKNIKSFIEENKGSVAARFNNLHLIDARNAKIIDSRLTAELNISNDEWAGKAERIESYLPEDIESKSLHEKSLYYQRYLSDISNAYIINPDILSFFPNFRDHTEDMKRVFNFTRSIDIVNAGTQGQGANLPSLDMAADLHIIDSLILSTSIDQSDWDRWNTLIDKALNSGIGWIENKYPRIASRMIILESKRLEITENGVRIVLPSQHVKEFSNYEKMPERRRF